MTVLADYEQRKDDHLQLAAEAAKELTVNQFDEIAFVHHALNGIDIGDIELATSFAGISCHQPVYINAMTGGSAMAKRINSELAAVAADFGLPIATGSMSAYLADSAAAETYSVLRRNNPSGVVMANVNANTSGADAQRAVELLDADALQIHLNSVQEIVMPEGDRNFRHWADRIAEINDALSVPVIVKEVGFGVSRETAAALKNLGVGTVDVAGNGGTNFAAIENSRRDRKDYEFLAGWGQSAVASLLEVTSDTSHPEVLASGGVRNPLDVVKALALGARAVGVAGHFLRVILDSGASELARLIEGWLDQLAGIMTILGASSVSGLQRTDILVSGSLAERSIRRGIAIDEWACRSTTFNVKEGDNR